MTVEFQIFSYTFRGTAMHRNLWCRKAPLVNESFVYKIFKNRYRAMNFILPVSKLAHFSLRPNIPPNTSSPRRPLLHHITRRYTLIKRNSSKYYSTIHTIGIILKLKMEIISHLTDFYAREDAIRPLHSIALVLSCLSAA